MTYEPCFCDAECMNSENCPVRGKHARVPCVGRFDKFAPEPRAVIPDGYTAPLDSRTLEVRMDDEVIAARQQ